MKTIKKLLFKLLSQRAYLRAMHLGFYFLYNLGFLKGKESFKYHYFVRKVISKTYTIVDIGANLGYFSKTFAKLANQGQVISIEPVPAFYQTLSHFLGKFPNVTIHNVALGTEDGKLEMVMPESDGMIRTGLPHIARNEQEKKLHKTVEVEIVRGSELLAPLTKIDYVKCDVEGYEWTVFQEIKPVIEKHRPVVQIEIAKENEENLFDYFEGLNYVQYGIADFQLVKEKRIQKEQGDFLFVPEEKCGEFELKAKAR